MAGVVARASKFASSSGVATESMVVMCVVVGVETVLVRGASDGVNLI